MNEKERWLPVVGYEDFYEVSSFGRVRSLDRVVRAKNGCNKHLKGKVLKAVPHSRDGYQQVYLFKLGKQATKKVHGLVMTTFIGEYPEGMEVRHLDGCRANNYLSNLCYGTKKENYADSILHGRDNKGVKNSRSKLTEENVLDIRIAYSFGFTLKSIAEHLAINLSTIKGVVYGRNWSHI